MKNRMATFAKGEVFMISSDVRDIVSSLQRIARALEGINSSLRGMKTPQLSNIDQSDEYLEGADDPALLRLIAALSKK